MEDDDEPFWKRIKNKLWAFGEDIATRNEGRTIKEIYFVTSIVSFIGFILSLVFIQPILVIIFIIIFFFMIYMLL
ncbi:MAG: hypothetical protein ACTSRB_09355 [Candidatus Helarchaeota archaeon]